MFCCCFLSLYIVVIMKTLVQVTKLSDMMMAASAGGGNRPNQKVDDFTPFWSTQDVKTLEDESVQLVAKVSCMVHRCATWLPTRL